MLWWLGLTGFELQGNGDYAPSAVLADVKISLAATKSWAKGAGLRLAAG